MPGIPVPCTNCFRFHYGVCYERPKQCRECGGINHMERYCPNKNKVVWKRGEPLPGTSKWCEMWGLNDDLDLKAKVLTAIKTYPGTAIWVNQVCIYQGNNRFFESEPMGRGRSLADRIVSRARSRSPARDKGTERHRRRRSRSPLRRYPSPDRWAPSKKQGQYQYQGDDFQSRDPARLSPAPYSRRDRPRTPSYTSGSNAVVYEARDESMKESPRTPLVSFAMPSRRTQRGNVSSTPMYLSGRPLSAFQPAAPAGVCGVLGDVTHKQNIPSSSAIIEQKQAENMGRPSTNAPEREYTPETFVEDPEFVLGIRRGSTEQEITYAYEQKMWEIEMSDPTLTSGGGTNIFDESIKIINAAKRQLLGY